MSRRTFGLTRVPPRTESRWSCSADITGGRLGTNGTTSCNRASDGGFEQGQKAMRDGETTRYSMFPKEQVHRNWLVDGLIGINEEEERQGEKDLVRATKRAERSRPRHAPRTG